MQDYGLTDEQKAVRQVARDFTRKEIEPIAAEMDEKEEFPREVYDKMGGLGFPGMLAPPEYGGSGAGYLALGLVLEEISKASSGIACCLVPHSGHYRAILRFGNEEQKRKYVTPLASGKRLGAFGMTEPDAGSDVASLQTTAILKGDHYIANGIKCFTTNGGEAEQYLLIARSKPKEEPSRGISAFIVEVGTPGFTFGKKERKMGFRANSTRDLIFQDCPIPKDNLLGEEGRGMRIGLDLMDYARMTAAASAVGEAQAALDHAIKYAEQRVQFGRPIGHLQAIQFMLADMATVVEASRVLTYRLCRMLDDDLTCDKEAAITKVFATDMAMKVASDAVQIFGGYGYMKDYPVEAIFRDAKLGQIFDGTNEIQRVIIARHLLRFLGAPSPEFG
jgi:hypothetical protein